MFSVLQAVIQSLDVRGWMSSESRTAAYLLSVTCHLCWSILKQVSIY